MARETITGRKPRVTADTIKCLKASTASGPPMPNEIAPTRHPEPKPAERGRRGPPIRGPPIERLAYTIRQFCEAHTISVDTYFRMQRAGNGPEIMKVGHKTLISIEAAAAWRRAREVAARRARETAAAEAEA